MLDNIPQPSGHDVYWERWADPYMADEEELLDSATPESEEEISFSHESELEENMMQLPSFSPIKTIFTPFGVLPLTEQSLASNHFKMWVGHTNFKLTKDFYKVIGSVEGVEAIDIFSPYRFRIAVGKLFVDRGVMTRVRIEMLKNLKGRRAIRSENQLDYQS